MAKREGRPASQLEAWYSKLSARHVDLVGDYAGKERFFVEGDSLLLEVFCNPQLDFEGTFLSGSKLFSFCNAIPFVARYAHGHGMRCSREILTISSRLPNLTCRLSCRKNHT